MRVAAALLLIAILATTLAAEQEPKALTWPHEGFAAISKAAQEAKAQGKRLLLGLSGGAT